jgi:hypothetical protein
MADSQAILFVFRAGNSFPGPSFHTGYSNCN